MNGRHRPEDPAGSDAESLHELADIVARLDALLAGAAAELPDEAVAAITAARAALTHRAAAVDEPTYEYRIVQRDGAVASFAPCRSLTRARGLVADADASCPSGAPHHLERRRYGRWEPAPALDPDGSGPQGDQGDAFAADLAADLDDPEFRAAYLSTLAELQRAERDHHDAERARLTAELAHLRTALTAAPGTDRRAILDQLTAEASALGLLTPRANPLAGADGHRPGTRGSAPGLDAPHVEDEPAPDA